MSGKTVFNDMQVQERLKSARRRIVRGKTEMAQLQKQLGCDGGLLEACDLGPSLVSVRARREYIGCSDRIASLCFSPGDSNRFATASHDGKLMVRDPGATLMNPFPPLSTHALILTLLLPVPAPPLSPNTSHAEWVCRYGMRKVG